MLKHFGCRLDLGFDLKLNLQVGSDRSKATQDYSGFGTLTAKKLTEEEKKEKKEIHH